MAESWCRSGLCAEKCASPRGGCHISLHMQHKDAARGQGCQAAVDSGRGQHTNCRPMHLSSMRRCSAVQLRNSQRAAGVIGNGHAAPCWQPGEGRVAQACGDVYEDDLHAGAALPEEQNGWLCESCDRYRTHSLCGAPCKVGLYDQVIAARAARQAQLWQPAGVLVIKHAHAQLGVCTVPSPAQAAKAQAAG